jgi:hypothetical protein
VTDDFRAEAMHGAPPAYLKERLHPLFQPTRGLWLLERFNKIGASIDAQARRRLAAPSSRERIARKDAEKAAVAVAVEQVKAIAVLDLVMPNGQRLLLLYRVGCGSMGCRVCQARRTRAVRRLCRGVRY